MDIEISKIGLGCVTFGREIGEDAAFALMDHAYEKGIRHFDTAAVYGGGASERIVGKWLASRKVNVLVATKLLPPFTKEGLYGSLERLGVDRIHLLYMHAYGEGGEVLLEDGLVGALGASNFTFGQLQCGLPFSYIQNNHNLAVSDLSSEIFSHCLAKEIRIVTYSPLGAGFLTGKHLQGVAQGSRFDIMPGHQPIYFTEDAQKRLQKLQQVADRTGHSMVHLALAWALHQPVDHVLIGGRHSAHVDQALHALTLNDPGLLAFLH